VVDEGDGPVAGLGEGAQPLDLRGDGVTLVARLGWYERIERVARSWLSWPGALIIRSSLH
jgi:hypothetical protein